MRMYRILLLITVPLAIATGCVKISTTTIADSEILYTPVIHLSSTKGVIDGVIYPKNEPFGTFAYKGTQLYIPFSKVEYNDTRGVWTTSTPYYWPSDGTALTFYSFSPYYVAESSTGYTPPTITCDSSNGITITDYDSYATKNHKADLMIATPVTTNATVTVTGEGDGVSYTGVSTQFNHILTYIYEFKVKTDIDYTNGHDGSAGNAWVAGDKQFFIDDIKFEKIYTKGSYSSTSGWTSLSNKLPTFWFTTYDDDTKSIKLSSTEFTLKRRVQEALLNDGYLFVIPQLFGNSDPENDAKITVKYRVKTFVSGSTWVTDTVEKSYLLNTIHGGSNPAWVKNKKLTYTLTFALNEIYWAPSIKDWVAAPNVSL